MRQIDLLMSKTLGKLATKSSFVLDMDGNEVRTGYYVPLFQESTEMRKTKLPEQLKVLSRHDKGNVCMVVRSVGKLLTVQFVEIFKTSFMGDTFARKRNEKMISI